MVVSCRADDDDVDGDPLPPSVLDLASLQRLLELTGRDRELIGPATVDGVIGWRAIDHVDQLPVGVHDDQAPGRYRLTHDEHDRSRFGWAVGPQTAKPVLHPPTSPVWRVTHDDDGFHVDMAEHPAPARTLFGMRPCEVAAMAKIEHVLAEGPHPDPVAVANRADRLVVAVDCTRPAATCFCASMGTGPACHDGADLALTELGGTDGDDPTYVARALTARGAALLRELGAPDADADALAAADHAVARAAAAQTRHVDRDAIPAVLRASAESPVWDAVAERCLTCGNCTAVCPTCFCTDVRDTTTLDGTAADRTRVWDTCFSLQFSRIAGHPVRTSVRSRYRQWLTHKLGTWWDQFGESGCVGCGRCITWCPVGIDLTEEAAALAAADRTADGRP